MFGVALPVVWAALAGLAAGFILGLLGAGGPVVGLPFLLYLADISPHPALGSNALGVSMIAAVLYGFRLRRREAIVAPGMAYAVPGMFGIYIGAQLGLHYPGTGLVFLLGFVLFAIAGWQFYLSAKVGGPHAPRTAPPGSGVGVSRGSLLKTTPVALAVGAASGFFGIGGGFMIVPSLALTAGVELTEAISSSLLPIAGFAGVVGASYLRAGDVDLGLSIVMLPLGLLGGYAGIWLGKRITKTAIYRVFASFLALLGVYFIIHG